MQETITVDAATVRRVLNTFRYGGMVAHSPLSVTDADSLIRWLETYSDAMVRISDRNTAQEAELSQIKSDLRATGRLLGLIQQT